MSSNKSSKLSDTSAEELVKRTCEATVGGAGGYDR